MITMKFRADRFRLQLIKKIKNYGFHRKMKKKQVKLKCTIDGRITHQK